MAKDPICGMKVDEKTTAGTSNHGGKAYYFCSTNCKAEFDRTPTKYLG